MNRRDLLKSIFLAPFALYFARLRSPKPLNEQFQRIIVRKLENHQFEVNWKPCEWEELKVGDYFRRMSDPNTKWFIIKIIDSSGGQRYLEVMKMKSEQPTPVRSLLLART